MKELGVTGSMTHNNKNNEATEYCSELLRVYPMCREESIGIQWNGLGALAIMHLRYLSLIHLVHKRHQK